MKNFIPVLSLVLLTSCSSVNENGLSLEAEKEFSWIENSDFRQEKEVVFNPSKDIFSGGISKMDSLSKESLARIPEDKLEVIVEGKDPLDQIVGLCYQRKFEAAQDIFRSVFEKFSQNPSLWNQMGTCHLLQGNDRKALLFYNKSRELNRRYSPPVNNLGVLYLKRGEPQKALAAFEKARDINRFSMTPLFNVGNLYLKYGLAKKAQAVFKILYLKNKGDLDVLAGLGASHLMLGDYSKAVLFYQGLTSGYLEKPEVGINYAIALHYTGSKEKALEVISDMDSSKSLKISRYIQSVKHILGQ